MDGAPRGYGLGLGMGDFGLIFREPVRGVVRVSGVIR